MSDGPQLLPKRPIFVNRVSEMTDFLAWQAESAAAGTPLLVAVTGAEGIGKTTFALMAGHQIAVDYPEAQLYCDMRGSQPAPVTADEAAFYFLTQLGAVRQDIPKDPAHRLGALRSRLAGRRVLMVLDDVGDIEPVRELLFESAAAAVVVTSRRPLTGLRVHDFRTLRLAKFTDADAAELIRAISAVDVAEQVVNQICVLCDGLPIALSIAAARLSDPDQPPEEYVEELLSGRTFEALTVDGMLPVQRVFDVSYQELDEDAAQAYTMLSLIPGPHFGAGAAAAVLERDEAATRRVLRALLSKHMLERYGDGRFRFHNLVRQHATDQAVAALSSTDLAQAVVRAVGWYWQREVALDQVVSSRPVPVPAAEHYRAVAPAYPDAEALSSAFAEFDVEWPNFVAAAHAARDTPGAELAGLFPLAMWSYGYATGRFNELIDLLTHAVGNARDDVLRWHLHRDLAAAYEGVGEYGQAQSHIRQAATVDYPEGRESLHTWYGFTLEGRGEYAAALAEFRTALNAVPQMTDPVHQERARALLAMHMGRNHYRLGAIDDAESALTAAWAYFEARPAERVNQARTGMYLGRVQADRGRSDTMLRNTLALLRDLGMSTEAAVVADWLAEYTQGVEAEEFRRLARELRNES